MKRIAVVILAALAIGAAGRSAIAVEAPRCQEDEVIVGTGNFEHGRWDRLVCIPADDLPLR